MSGEDPIFETVLQLMVVEAVKERYAVGRVHVFAGAPAFASAFGQHAERWLIAGLARVIAFGLLSRLALIIEYVGLWWILRTLPSPPVERRDVLLQGYWDWTVRPAGDGSLIPNRGSAVERDVMSWRRHPRIPM